MKILPYTFLILLILFSGCATSYKYEVHLIEGGGYHHLITTETADEALDFMAEHEDSHGAMKVIKVE
jgi:hypothetical protein